MNAVPAADDISPNIPRASLPANEAELSRDTHAVIKAFNGALDFLEAADTIRTWPPTSRIPNGRIWGPWPMNDHPGWQMRFTMSRDPAAPEMFGYRFEVEPIGAGDADGSGSSTARSSRRAGARARAWATSTCRPTDCGTAGSRSDATTMATCFKDLRSCTRRRPTRSA